MITFGTYYINASVQVAAFSAYNFRSATLPLSKIAFNKVIEIFSGLESITCLLSFVAEFTCILMMQDKVIVFYNFYLRLKWEVIYKNELNVVIIFYGGLHKVAEYFPEGSCEIASFIRYLKLQSGQNFKLQITLEQFTYAYILVIQLVIIFDM